MATRKPVTETDLKALQQLHDIMSDFLVNMKDQATAANKNQELVVRRYFEKYIVSVSDDVQKISARITRINKALYRKETKDLAAALENASGAEEESEAS